MNHNYYQAKSCIVISPPDLSIAIHFAHHENTYGVTNPTFKERLRGTILVEDMRKLLALSLAQEQDHEESDTQRSIGSHEYSSAPSPQKHGSKKSLIY